MRGCETSSSLRRKVLRAFVGIGGLDVGGAQREWLGQGQPGLQPGNSNLSPDEQDLRRHGNPFSYGSSITVL